MHLGLLVAEELAVLAVPELTAVAAMVVLVSNLASLVLQHIMPEVAVVGHI
jgi:hypothetical protein